DLCMCGSQHGGGGVTVLSNVRVGAGVYIRAASDLKDAQDLTNAGITYILTVDSEQPTSPDEAFRMKYVYSLDESSTDLLSHLHDCILFICDSCKASKAVLVHWCLFCSLYRAKSECGGGDCLLDEMSQNELRGCIRQTPATST
uniref:Uncharacterized protein n=1 Tax=Hucho hucho TaxID=62062 RepID=A0A4W5K889_9TELE